MRVINHSKETDSSSMRNGRTNHSTSAHQNAMLSRRKEESLQVLEKLKAHSGRGVGTKVKSRVSFIVRLGWEMALEDLDLDPQHSCKDQSLCL